MLRIFIVLFLAVPLFFSFRPNETTREAKDVETFAATPTPPASEGSGVSDKREIIFDKREVLIPCPPGSYAADDSCPAEMKVRVGAFFFPPDGPTASYRYSVSGGFIIGEGDSVVWNLNGVKPGIYALSAKAEKDGVERESTETVTVRDCSRCRAVIPPPADTPEIEDVILDRETVFTWCPNEELVPEEARFCSKSQLSVKVSTIVKGAQTDGLTFHYTISGGRIVGQGANVIWNLENTQPGNYAITAAIGKDGRVGEKTATKSLELKNCPNCDLPCICPTVAISGPAKVASGKRAAFKALVSGEAPSDKKYQWSVSGGEIIRGRNASEVVVRANKNSAGKSMFVDVRLGGSYPPPCPCEPSAKTTALIE